MLAGHEPWADESTRELLSQRAVDDEDYQPRAKALELLAGHEPWADHEETLAARQTFIVEIFRDGVTPEQRGEAACLWFRSAGRSDHLAYGKERVFSRDADGIEPYLDPYEPISDEHLSKVALKASISDDQRDEMVEQMNATLGWDIRSGFPEQDR